MIAWLRPAAAAWCVAVTVGCGGAAPVPAEIDTRHDACRSCRMTISDLRFAAQIVAPGEEPLAFDDLGCLADYLRGGAARRADAVIFVADHRTREWLRADIAVFTRVAALATPMSSHLIAHRDAASRDQDADAAGGVPVALEDVIPSPGGAAR